MKKIVLFTSLIISCFATATAQINENPQLSEVSSENIDGRYKFSLNEITSIIEISLATQSFVEYDKLGNQLGSGSFIANELGYTLTPSLSSLNLGGINAIVKFKVISATQNSMTIYFKFPQEKKQKLTLKKI